MQFIANNLDIGKNTSTVLAFRCHHSGFTTDDVVIIHERLLIESFNTLLFRVLSLWTIHLVNLLWLKPKFTLRIYFATSIVEDSFAEEGSVLVLEKAILVYFDCHIYL